MVNGCRLQFVAVTPCGRSSVVRRTLKKCFSQPPKLFTLPTLLPLLTRLIRCSGVLVTLRCLHYLQGCPSSPIVALAYNSAPCGLRSPSSFSPFLPQPLHPIVPALASPIGRARLNYSDSTNLICSPTLRYGWRFCVPFHVPDFPAPHSVCYLQRYGFVSARFSAHLSTVSI